MTRPIRDLDVQLSDLLRRLAAQPHQPATPGESAELRHLLYDADPDATEPAFPYPNTQEA